MKWRPKLRGAEPRSPRQPYSNPCRGAAGQAPSINLIIDAIPSSVLGMARIAWDEVRANDKGRKKK